jgi:extracellular factor (EF) 3-hydroxypalmitic acid methyl ester biosynthesis protein
MNEPAAQQAHAKGAPEPTLDAELELGGVRTPTVLCTGTRISLRARFEGPAPADRTVFDRVLVRLGEREARLSRCRYHADAPDGGHLVFLDEVYDARSLIYDRKLVDLRGAFQSVPAVLGQKETVRPEFRAYVSDLTYDLSVWKRFFDDQDAVLAQEPAEAEAAAREALLQTVGRAFMSFLDRQLDRLAQVTAGFSNEEHERHGFYLRRQVWPYIETAAFMHRTNTKPYGYSGDAEMMRFIYENRFVGDSLFGQLLHKHPVEAPGSQAVRNRRRFVPRVLREVAARRPPREPFRFLSVAAGPAWELQDVFQSPQDAARFQCALLDQDPHALAAARDHVARIEHQRNVRLKVEWHQDSVRTMLRMRDLASRFGRHHFVYSMGLFDYLTPPVARVVLERMYELLLPGGTLLVGNYHAANPSRLYMEYWLDWALFLRTEESLLALAEGIPDAARSISRDDSRCQMFLQLEKPA